MDILCIYSNKRYIRRIYLAEKNAGEAKMEIKDRMKRDNAYITQTTIRKWGNSQGIRLSKEVLSQMSLKENDTIEIDIYDGKMIIEKINKPKYLNLQERLEGFYKQPIEEIYVESTQEVDVGDPVGNEQW